MALTPSEVKSRLKGLLSFPVSPFTTNNTVDLPRYRDHLEFMLEHRPSGLFACGGTGEFFSLTPSEYAVLVRTAVETLQGRTLVIGAAGYGTQLAIEYAQAAEAAGADAVLVLPPYLVQAEQEGLYNHYAAIARSVRIGIIPYMRDNAVFNASTVARLAELPNVIGFKDGLGDMERLGRIIQAVGDRLVFINGMPTAEASALAFQGLGVDTYSSAIFNFAPQVAQQFYQALISKDRATIDQLLRQVYLPLCEIRDRRRGYAVALIKEGMRMIGRPMGHVRSPLVSVNEADIQDLHKVFAPILA